jgi:hypothetical protein
MHRPDSFDVFISHSSKDSRTASAIKQALQNEGIRCWKAPDDILPGESWPAAITRAVSVCKVMVLVWSSNSIQSAEVSKELTLAMSRGLMVIPYKIENIAPNGEWEYHLANSHWLDVCGDQELLAISKLSERLRPFFQKEKKKDPSPTAETNAPALEEWRESLWWLHRSGSIKALDQKKLDALQQKLGIADGVVSALKQAYRRNLEEITELLEQAFEDGILEEDEAEALELARKECCISSREMKSLLENLRHPHVTLPADCPFEWLSQPDPAKQPASSPKPVPGPDQSTPSQPPSQIPPPPPEPTTSAAPVTELSAPPPDVSQDNRPLEAIFHRIKSRFHSDDLFWEPTIPSKKLANARRSYGIPGEEHVFGLIDATVFGSANNGMALCSTGLYLHNDWSAKNSGGFFVPWENVVDSEHKSEEPAAGTKWTELVVGEGIHFNMSGSRASPKIVRSMLVELVNDLRTSGDVARGSRPRNF